MALAGRRRRRGAVAHRAQRPARRLRHRHAHRAPAPEPAGGAARCGAGHAGAVAAGRPGRGGRAAPAGALSADPGRAAPRRGQPSGPKRNCAAPKQQSLAARRAVLADADFANGRYLLLLAAEPASFALQMDLRAVVPWSEWPMAPETSPVRVTLEHDGQSYLLQPGAERRAAAWRFDFHKHLASDSQPFDVAAVRAGGLGRTALGLDAGMGRRRGRLPGGAVRPAAPARAAAARRRAVAAGPGGPAQCAGRTGGRHGARTQSAADGVMANAQAAQRLLDDDPPELATARGAMAQAAQQARRAADVIGRLRRVVERPDTRRPAAARGAAGRGAQRPLPAGARDAPLRRRSAARWRGRRR